MAAVKKEWLKGLKFAGSTAKKEKTDNGERVRHVPFERELRPTDLLAARLTSAGLVLVAADGRKHTVVLDAASRKKIEGQLAAPDTDEPAE